MILLVEFCEKGGNWAIMKKRECMLYCFKIAILFLLPILCSGCWLWDILFNVDVDDEQLEKTMHIEYDHQVSYDVFFRQEGLDDLEDAFANAGTDVDLWDGGEVIADEIIDYAFADVEAYSRKHRDDTTNYNMHLLGVQAAKNHPTILGVSEGGGGPFSWSFVFVQTIKDHPNVNDEDNMIERVTIHELGHQRANLTEADEHPELHSSSDCVMYRTYSPHAHPQFCSKCQQTIKTVSW